MNSKILAGYGIEHPFYITFAAALAHSFDVSSGINANIAGSPLASVTDPSSTWAEFGICLDTHLCINIDLNIDLSGTTAGDPAGTAVHGGAGVTYNF